MKRNTNHDMIAPEVEMEVPIDSQQEPPHPPQEPSFATRLTRLASPLFSGRVESTSDDAAKCSTATGETPEEPCIVTTQESLSSEFFQVATGTLQAKVIGKMGNDEVLFDKA